MSWSRVTHVERDPGNNSSTQAIAIPAAQNAGDLIVCFVTWDGTTTTITGVTDTKGNTYNAAKAPVSGQGLTVAMYYAFNVGAAASSANTVTVTWPSARNFGAILVAVYRSSNGPTTTDPLRAAGVQAAGAGTAASVTFTGGAGDLAYAGCASPNNVTAAGSGWTSIAITASDGYLHEEKLSISAGSQTATATTAGGFSIVAASFIEPSAAGGALSGTSAAVGSASGTLAGVGALSATSAGVGSTSGTLAGAGALAGASAAISSSSGVLSGVSALNGTSAAISASSGTLTGAGAIAGTSNAVAAPSGVLAGVGALAGASAAASAPIGTISGAGSLAGTAAAIGTASATLSGFAAIVASSAGVASAAGVLSGGATGTLSGSSAGVGNAVATLLAMGQLFGTSVAVGSASGTLTGGGAPPVFPLPFPRPVLRPFTI